MPHTQSDLTSLATTMTLFIKTLTKTYLKNTLKLSSTSSLSLRYLNSVSNEHQPPLNRYGIPARYANATYISASKKSSLSIIEKDLLSLLPSLQTNHSFYQYVTNPLIKRKDKITKMEELFSNKFHNISVNLLTTLAGNNQFENLEKIIGIYQEYMREYRGDVVCKVVSVETLGKKEMKDVEKAIEWKLNQENPGKKKNLILETEVNPDLLGGLVVEMGSVVLDFSVKSRIDDLERLGKM